MRSVPLGEVHETAEEFTLNERKKGGGEVTSCNERIYADTVFINGKVITVDADFSIKKAIAIRNGWIIDVGENAEIREYIGDETQVIDLQGKTIMPGACDAHCHSAVYGLQRYVFDCTNDISLPKFQKMIRESVEKAKPGEWVKGTGFLIDSFEEFEKDPSFTVTRHEIDEVAPDNPVWILDAGAHNLLVNTKALEVCGITKDTPDPQSGHFEKDEKGELTGFIVETGAMEMINKHVPLWSVDELKEMILYFQNTLVAEGITSYTDGMMGPGGNYRDGGADGEMAIRADSHSFVRLDWVHDHLHDIILLPLFFIFIICTMHRAYFIAF